MPAQLARGWEAVRSSLWFLPSLLVLGGMALAFLMIDLEGTLGQEAARRLPLLFAAGPEGARGVLTALASSVLTLAGISFSSTVVALSISAGTYTPRILRNFASDRGNQLVLGAFLGQFVYCLLVLRVVREGQRPFVPSLAVTGAILLTLVNLGLFIYFIHHIVQSIQVSTITQSIARGTREALDKLFPESIGTGPGDEARGEGAAELPEGRAVAAPRGGYVRLVEPEKLMELATERDLVIRMERGMGDFVPEGAPLATVAPGERVYDDTTKRILRIYDLGRQRTITEDPAFGFRQLVDLAVKALSPGINDVTTATTCVDHLGDLLRRLSGRDIPSPFRYDGDGRLRVVALGPSYSDLVGLAFDQIRVAGRTQAAVMLRLLGVVRDLASITDAPERRRVLLEHAEYLRQAADSGLTDESDRLRVGRELASVRHSLQDVGYLGTL